MKTATADLQSKSGVTTYNQIMVAPFDLTIVSVVVVFNTKPDGGSLNVGTDEFDPDEIVDNFNLSTLTNFVPQSMALVGTRVLAGRPIWAKIGPAGASAGIGGGITVNYLPD